MRKFFVQMYLSYNFTYNHLQCINSFVICLVRIKVENNFLFNFISFFLIDASTLTLAFWGAFSEVILEWWKLLHLCTSNLLIRMNFRKLTDKTRLFLFVFVLLFFFHLKNQRQTKTQNLILIKDLIGDVTKDLIVIQSASAKPNKTNSKVSLSSSQESKKEIWSTLKRYTIW